MVDLRAIKLALRTLLGELREGFASNPSTHNLLLTRRRSRGINDDHTGGYWAEVGRLSRAISVELWLDHYSGIPTPRAWIGCSSASFKDLSLLAQQAKRLGFRRYPTIKTSRDAIPLMQMQCEQALGWLRSGRIEGIIIYGGTTVDLGFEAVDWTREWIQRVGQTKL